MSGSLWTNLPVTALHVSDGYLYSGSGGTLHVYNNSHQKPKHCETVSVFNHSVIHGIKTFKVDGERFILIFGGKQVAVLKLGEHDISIARQYKCRDWIWDVQPLDTGTQLAIALAHNSCALYNWKNDEILNEVHCSVKCILYSASLLKRSWNDIVLFAGTVFNQIVVWSPGAGKSNDPVQPFLTIPGHDGVIFDIFYCHKYKLLLSASDDRSVRIWRCPNMPCDSDEATCACVMYGHEARIWKVRLISHDDQPYVVSISEDGFCIVWMLSLSNDSGDISFKIVKKLDLHSNLLSFCCDEKGRFSVGCSNGAIYWYDLKSILSPVVCDSAPPFDQVECGTAKVVKLWSLGNNQSVLVYTDKGCLMSYCLESQHWTVVRSLPEYGSYAVMSLSKCQRIVAIGNTKGSVIILHLSPDLVASVCEEFIDFDSKIQNLSWHGKELFVSGPNGRLHWYHVNHKVVKLSSFILPQAKHRWHMDALVLESHEQVVCGDRRGSIHLFSKGISTPVCTVHGVHGKHGVTFLTEQSGAFVSTGRDGYWRRFEVRNNKIELLTQHRAAQGMDWLERTEFDRKQNLYICGFRGNKFIVWSKFSGNEMFSVACGGCHRSWDFSSSLSKFVFLKASQLNIVQVPTNVFDESLIEQGFHNHQINCVRFISSYMVDGSRVDVIATAGEDTKVMISSLVSNKFNCEATVLHVIDDHCSSVRTIRILPLLDMETEMEVLMFTAGGRAMLNAYKVCVQKNIIPDTTTCCVRHEATYKSGASSDMRFMDLAAWNSEDDGAHKVAVACSDGRIRLFELEERNLTMISQSHDTGHCFLVASRLDGRIVTGATDGFLRFMTSTMDEVGRLRTNQSGVNALAVGHVTVGGARRRCLATGGDDNSIVTSVVTWEGDDVVELVRCFVVDAHATQVTGLYFDGTDEGLLLISTSVDQRVNSWRVNASEDNGSLALSCQQLSSRFTHVADVASIDVLKGRYVISGRGLHVADLMTSHGVALHNSGT